MASSFRSSRSPRLSYRFRYSRSRYAGNDSARNNIEYLGSATLLPGSEAIPTARQSQVDSFTPNLRGHGRQHEVGTATPSQQMPGGLLSESPEISAELPYSQRAVVHGYTNPLDTNSPSDIYARHWPEYPQGVLPFLNLNDEGVANSLLHFRTTAFPPMSLRPGTRGRVMSSQPRPRQSNMRTGGSGLWQGNNIPGVEEYGFSNPPHTQFPPGLLEMPEPWSYFDDHLPYVGHANPYDAGFNPNYGAQEAHIGHLNQYYPVPNPYYGPQNFDRGPLNPHHDIQNTYHGTRNNYHGPQNNYQGFQNAYHGTQDPYYGPQNPPYGDAYAFNGYQNAVIDSGQGVTMPRQNMGAIGEQNIPLMARQNMQATSSFMPASSWTGVADGGYDHDNLTAGQMAQYQYGSAEIDGMARRQGVPIPPNHGMNNFLHTSQPMPMDMRTETSHWNESFPNGELHYMGSPRTLGAPGPAFLQSFGRPRAGSRPNLRGMRRLRGGHVRGGHMPGGYMHGGYMHGGGDRGGRGATRVRRYASDYYNQG